MPVILLPLLSSQRDHRTTQHTISRYALVLLFVTEEIGSDYIVYYRTSDTTTLRPTFLSSGSLVHQKPIQVSFQATVRFSSTSCGSSFLPFQLLRGATPSEMDLDPDFRHQAASREGFSSSLYQQGQRDATPSETSTMDDYHQHNTTPGWDHLDNLHKAQLSPYPTQESRPHMVAQTQVSSAYEQGQDQGSTHVSNDTLTGYNSPHIAASDLSQQHPCYQEHVIDPFLTMWSPITSDQVNIHEQMNQALPPSQSSSTRLYPYLTELKPADIAPLESGGNDNFMSSVLMREEDSRLDLQEALEMPCIANATNHQFSISAGPGTMEVTSLNISGLETGQMQGTVKGGNTAFSNCDTHRTQHKSLYQSQVLSDHFQLRIHAGTPRPAGSAFPFSLMASSDNP